MTREINIEELLSSKVYVKESSAVSFKPPKDYVLDFVNIPAKDADFRVVVNDPVINAEEDGKRNIAYPRAMIEFKVPGIKELPGFEPVVGMVYALDVQKPVIKTYSGFNVLGCINLTIFNADNLYQTDLLGNYQSIYNTASKYYDEKEKELVTFSETLSKLKETSLNERELDYYIGLIIRKAMNTRLGTTNIIGAIKDLYNPASSYFVGPEHETTKFNLYNAVTQQITKGTDIVDRAKKTIQLSEILVNN